MTQNESPRLGPKPPSLAALTSARLAAVQGLYEITYNKRPMRAVVEEALAHKERTGSPGSGFAPDPSLLKRILFGVEERSIELDILFKSVVRRRVGGSSMGPEPLLRAGILCGLYELMAHDDIDAPIIINDYLTIMRGFYGTAEVGFVNGILDSVAKTLRHNHSQDPLS